ncbi:MAG: WD40 repeat domain-containing protein, partial [Candidatus Nanopelagicales bacterium]
FSPDGDRIVSASWDYSLKLWDAHSGVVLRTLIGQGGPLHRCVFSPDGHRIVSTSANKTLVVWDAESGVVLHTLMSHDDFVEGCAFSPDGHKIVSASDDHTLKVWDAHTGAELYTLCGHTDGVEGCAFTPDGHQIVSASGDHALRVWATAEGSPVARVELPESLLSVACHPWLPQMACGDKTGALYRVELMGIGHAPTVVTAKDRGPGLVVRCPACQRDHPLERSRLGSDLACPTEGCGLNLHVNTFVLTLS